jgi:single-strand DNA-binding protein
MRHRDHVDAGEIPCASFTAQLFRMAIPELMGKWALAAFYDQANNRLRLRFPLCGPSVFWLDRGVCTPLQFPSGMSLIDRKDRTMQNIAEFRIIGRVGKITEHDKVTKLNVAANYNRQENGEWVTDTHWNEVTLFGKLTERAAKAQKGDLVHITGRVRQNSYDTAEGRRYTVELIADGFAVLAKGSEDRD